MPRNSHLISRRLAVYSLITMPQKLNRLVICPLQSTCERSEIKVRLEVCLEINIQIRSSFGNQNLYYRNLKKTNDNEDLTSKGRNISYSILVLCLLYCCFVC